MALAELQTFILSTGKEKCPNCFGFLEAFLYIQAIKCLDGSIWNFLGAHASHHLSLVILPEPPLP